MCSENRKGAVPLSRGIALGSALRYAGTLRRKSAPDRPRMRVSEKLSLIDSIARTLQSRYRYEEIDAFLAAFGVQPPAAGTVTTNSKWVYSKVALQTIADSELVRIAEELELAAPGGGPGPVAPPRNWQDTKLFRLFISHISADKTKATRLKDCLAPYAITGFVAHEDIHPTLEWQMEIERALRTMDAFLAIHTPGFSQSYWTQQEVGFALGRGVKVISLKMGEDPTGFISKRQALGRRQRTADEIAREVRDLLVADEFTSPRLAAANGSIASGGMEDDLPF